MHDAGSYACTAVWKLFEVISECVRERAAVNSSSGMDDKSGRLVHYNERVVFVDDLDWNRFGSKAG